MCAKNDAEYNVKKDWLEQFDASVGLAFSLRAFERYRTSGTFSAEVRAVPGISGRYQAYLELIEGKVVSCYVINRAGERHHLMLESLIKLDEVKGPFNWTFRTTSASTFTEPLPEQPARASAPQAPRSPIPIRLVHYLDSRQLQRWTPEQQQCLHMVFSLINGRYAIDEIKGLVPLPPNVVDIILGILFQLQAIAIQ